MKKNTFKCIVTILTIIVMLLMIASTVFAAEELTPGKLKGNTTSVSNGVNSIKDIGNTFIGILRTVGIVLSVIILMILGIKYMMGSAEEKAEYKKTMIPYIVGAVFIFAASALTDVVFNFVSTIGTK